MKQVQSVRKNNEGHWVGDAFPVRTLFSYSDDAQTFSPFLLLDYAAPFMFTPSPKHKRGVGEHPHRGFETVTIVYSGEVDHRDSSGAGGSIGPGDVQWMTAASGIVHEEFHSQAFSDRGGLFEVVQLWVNLPKKDKLSKPHYQGILNKQIPVVNLPNDAGTARIIAGELQGAKGSATTFTPINLWDLRLNEGKSSTYSFQPGHNCLILVLDGKVKVGDTILNPTELAVLDSKETTLQVSALAQSKCLILSGEPIPEPVFGYGPFVMNNENEIRQAITDYQSGRMGHLS